MGTFGGVLVVVTVGGVAIRIVGRIADGVGADWREEGEEREEKEEKEVEGEERVSSPRKGWD